MPDDDARRREASVDGGQGAVELPVTPPVSVSCTACGPQSQPVLSLPERVTCSECGRRLGSLAPATASDRALLAADYGAVVDYATGAELAEVVWEGDRVEVDTTPGPDPVAVRRHRRGGGS